MTRLKYLHWRFKLIIRSTRGKCTLLVKSMLLKELTEEEVGLLVHHNHRIKTIVTNMVLDINSEAYEYAIAKHNANNKVLGNG